MQDQLFNMLIKKDEITWQDMIYDLIKSEQMNPWDIDISVLTKRYLETIQKLKEANFFVSGKMLLASSILLRIKSDKLVNEEIFNFDSQLYKNEDEFEELEDPNFKDAPVPLREDELPKLTIKTPLARKRRVNINDLMSALQKALEVNQRRVLRDVELDESKIPVPIKTIDISQLIKDVYARILGFFKANKNATLTFKKLILGEKKEDKIVTFLPLLYLDNQEKISLEQDSPFGEIKILTKENG
ncbi:hypothetical protein CL617_05610 [archaeon]|nr:hypothetical protein [archaeon]|tara:strand:- start:1227 stop:1958 length:732 start_codon:yes stop_codon:yes gene_type:complete